MKKVRCPTCGRLAAWSKDNPWRPFCSERCRDIDRGRWVDGTYRIPGEEAPPDSVSQDPGGDGNSEAGK